MYDGSGCATLVWFDPGVTTGLAVVSIRPGWLLGDGPSNFHSLGLAVEGMWHAQVGRHYRQWNTQKNKAEVPAGGKNIIPRKRGLTARNESVDGFPVHSPGNLLDVLNGRGKYRGGEPTTGLRDEILQVVECQRLLDNWPDAAWGYEDFVPRTLNQTREFIAPIRLFSMLGFSEIVHGSRGRIPFIQSASQAKSTVDDQRLQDCGLYRPGMHHANDAMRHAATFFRRARADAELREAAWPQIFANGYHDDFYDAIDKKYPDDDNQAVLNDFVENFDGSDFESTSNLAKDYSDWDDEAFQ